MQAELEASVKRWGNSLGIVVPASLARQLNVQPGSKVHLVIRHDPGTDDPDDLPTWDWGGDYDIDTILDEET